MKNAYLILILTLLSTGVYAQYRINQKQLKAEKEIEFDRYLEKNFIYQKPSIVATGNSHGNRATNSYGVEVGATCYDYQTNGTMNRRVVSDPDGNVTVVWTHGEIADAPAFNNRRVGYNFYNASTGQWSGMDTTGGGTRRGWPSLAASQGPEDIIFSHTTQALHYRPIAGTGQWTHTNLDGLGVSGTTFANTAAWGDTIHHISEGVTPDGTECFLYSRSPDNGQSWDLTDVALPNMDSANFYNDGGQGIAAGDGFAIDARGNTVAIVTGGRRQHTHFWKSTDRGDTWTHNRVFIFDTACADVQSTGTYLHLGVDDGYSIAIDKDEKVHIAGGLGASGSDPGTIGGGTTFYPFVSGIVYWNEDKPFDICLNDTLINDEYIILDFVDENGDGINSTPTDFDSIARYYNHNPLCYVSISHADDGTVVLTWSGVREDMVLQGIFLTPGIDGLDRVNRDLYALASTDGGATWEADSARNIADDIAMIGGGFGTPVEEDVFSYAFPRIGNDNLVHLVFQTDDVPGGVVRDDETPANSYIIHYAFNYNQVILPTGIEQAVQENVQMDVFPNPAAGRVSVGLDLEQDADYTLSIVDLMGRTMMETDVDLSKGHSMLDLDISRYDAGVYLISIGTANGKLTKKLIVE